MTSDYEDLLDYLVLRALYRTEDTPYEIGDVVSFKTRQEPQDGLVLKAKPKCLKVDSQGQTWLIPIEFLIPFEIKRDHQTH